MRDHVVGVTAIVGDAGHLAPLAGEKVTAAAGLAVPAVSAMPTDSDPLTLGPAHDACADRINNSGNLMSRDSRVLNTWEGTLLGQRVAVADATRLDLDAYPPGGRLRNFTFDKFKLTIRLSNLDDAHLLHELSFSHAVSRGVQ